MDADYIEGQFDPNLSFYLNPKQFLSPTTIDSYTSSIVSPTLELSASLYDQNRVTSSLGETHTMGNLDFHLAPNNTLTSTLFNELKTDVSKQQMNLNFRAEPQTNYSKPVFNYSETDKEIELGSNVIGGVIQNEDVSKSLLEQPHHQQQQQLKRTKLDMLAKHCNVSLLRKNSRQEKIDDSGNDAHGQAEGYLNGSIDRKASLTKLTNQSVADQSTPSHMRLDPMNIQSKV
ncbi:hypothetical protein QR98_0046640 [Sarcoptes scabiei]|uniref:Uncharacterized protein n=1 Tax=Sarcoptes scabiei TaxID=52283 RepID=A0A132A5F3_SARSC|nr:hypothetical protein QR98_0046640 [Sarcoptes scabiei]